MAPSFQSFERSAAHRRQPQMAERAREMRTAHERRCAGLALKGVARRLVFFKAGDFDGRREPVAPAGGIVGGAGAALDTPELGIGVIAEALLTRRMRTRSWVAMALSHELVWMTERP